jgi:hypothetical protein
MSVAPDSMWNLPHHQRPRQMGRGSTGHAQDHVFSILAEALHASGLVARPDPEAPAVHALVEPVEKVLLETFERSVTATRPSWSRVWP